MSQKEYIDLIVQYRNEYTQLIHNVIANNFPTSFILIFQIIIKSLIVVCIFYILHYILNKFIVPQMVIYFNNNKNNNNNEYLWGTTLYKFKVFHKFLSIIPAFLCYLLVPFLFYHHPISFEVSYKIFIIIIMFLCIRIVNSFVYAVQEISSLETNYKSIALNSFVQILRIFVVLTIIITIICIIFDISYTQIFTTIGAVTAIFLLIFRDPILGFISGLHISTARLVKLGDWVSFPKYDIEGYIKEINLLTVKIENFDKSTSTIPTYEMINSEMRSFQPLLKEKKRIIKRSIFLNINSFKFLDNSELELFKQNPLISDYIIKKQKDFEILKNQNLENEKIFEMQLTNVGLFRVFIYNYLLKNINISKAEKLIVRQKEISINGLPLEIFCFTNTAKFEQYEAIQSDVFDFVLTSVKLFKLEIIQSGVKNV